jgi:hypothetical protein
MPYALEDLGRPRVVAILKSHISETTVEKILPVLFISESPLTFSEKIGIAFATHRPSWLRRDFNGRISCGDHPHLWARRVRDLYAESHDDACDHQTLHWTEPPRYKEDPQTLQLVEASPAYPVLRKFGLTSSGTIILSQMTRPNQAMQRAPGRSAAKLKEEL